MLVQEHFDFVVQDYAIVRLIDFFLLQLVQFVVQETLNKKFDFRINDNKTNLIFCY